MSPCERGCQHEQCGVDDRVHKGFMIFAALFICAAAALTVIGVIWQIKMTLS
jgi:hypothetical protein